MEAITTHTHTWAPRCITGGLHDSLEINEPTAWAWMMTILVHTLLFLAAVAFPAGEFAGWLSLVEPQNVHFLEMIEEDSIWCFHWWSLFQGTVFCSCYICSLVLIDDLQDPFDVDVDSFNVDGVMSGTERTTFCTLRSQFDERSKEPSQSGVEKA